MSGIGRGGFRLAPQHVRKQTRLAIALAMVAGFVDGFGLLKFSTYLSFMSGNTTQTGANLGRAAFGLAIPSAIAIGAFLAGVILGNLWSRPEKHARTVFLIVGVTLGITCAGLRMLLLDPFPAIAIVACSMGLMNTAFSRVGNEPVNLTFVTGALNKLGGHLARAGKGLPLDGAMGDWDTHARRAALLASIWGAFLIGAVLAGIATGLLGDWTLLVPALAVIGVGLFLGGTEAGPSSAADANSPN